MRSEEQNKMCDEETDYSHKKSKASGEIENKSYQCCVCNKVKTRGILDGSEILLVNI